MFEFMNIMYSTISLFIIGKRAVLRFRNRIKMPLAYVLKTKDP